MFSLLRDDPKNELLRDRLSRLVAEIRELKLSTREEYQAEVYSRVNGLIALGNRMLPLLPVTAEGPAVVGDVSLNLSRLNQDASDIASQIGRVEDTAARLYNLAAASQNALRQQIREALYGSNSRRFLETFIHDRNLADASATVEFNAGVASLPLVDETEVKPAIAVGTNSEGEVEVGADALLDGKIETALVFNGTKLELILTFSKPEIINRLRVELDDYQGLEITSLTSSPDGSIYEDVLADLGVRTLLLNGVAGKYSGDAILDFPPRHAKQMRIVIEDRVDTARIALRSLTVLRRRYESQGSLVTKPIYLADSDVYAFSTSELVSTPFTTVTHQISTDGVHFNAISTGDVKVKAPFWYKAILQRGDSVFSDEGSALVPAGADLKLNENYGIRRVSTVPLGGGMIERTIILENVIGPIQLRDVPLPNTLRVQEGSVTLEKTEYTFSANLLSFSGNKALVTVTYQTSALGAAALQARKEFFTPLLYEVRFEKQ